MTSLHDILQTSYDPNIDNRQSYASKHGYEVDREFSNGDHTTFVHHKNKKIIYAVNGTQYNNGLGTAVRDWKNNTLIALGQGRKTDRYKEEKGTLERAKKKYAGHDTTLVAHSQGAFHTSNIASPNDRVINYNGAFTAGQHSKPNENHIRHEHDVVSLLSAGVKHGTKVKGKKKIPTSFNDILGAHNLDNIKDSGIFVH